MPKNTGGFVSPLSKSQLNSSYLSLKFISRLNVKDREKFKKKEIKTLIKTINEPSKRDHNYNFNGALTPFSEMS